MNCCICKNHPKFICSCISPSVFICNEHLDLHTSEPGNHVFRVSKSTDLFPILFNDLKMIRARIIKNSHLEIKKIVDQTNKSIKHINNCIKNLETNLDINETNLLKMIYGFKSLKFVNFEDLEKKYFYRVLEEEDGVYKGTIGLGQNDVFLKEGREKKSIKTVNCLKENGKTIKEKEKEFINMQMGLFMKASLKIVK